MKKGRARLGFVEPLTAIVAAFCVFGLLLYKRVHIGIILTVTALFLALLALDWGEIPSVIYKTTDPTTIDGRLAISVTLATFMIMLLSQLYKETGMIQRLSNSIGELINNPKAVLCVLPAVIGFLPVAGGALMSAPLVDAEAEKLKMEPDRKAYVNLWFRHTIFPVYPISLPLIVAAGLTGVAISVIMLRQIPVVIAMIVVGYVIGFWKIQNVKNSKSYTAAKVNSSLKVFLVAFSPILSTIVVTVILDAAGLGLSQQGFDVLLATFVGLIVLIAISKLEFKTFAKPFRNWGVYGVTLAAYAAFLLRKTMVESGISSILTPIITNASIDIALLLIIVPAVFGFLTGSPQGGIALSISILSGVLASFSPKVAALIYISAYLGYTVAPTHLCFQFTADYFKCSMNKMYKYVIPSVAVSFATAILLYLFV